MSLTRQILRDSGMRESELRLKKRFPSMTRKQRREYAKKLHKVAWERRDKEGIERMKRYTEQAVEILK